MAIALYRLGRFCFRRRGLVLVVWVLLLAGAGATTLAAEPFVTDFAVPDSGSERAQQIMEDKFPESRGTQNLATAYVVIEAAPGTTLDSPDNSARIQRLVHRLRALADLAAPQSVTNPLTDPAAAARVGSDRSRAYIPLTWTTSFDRIDSAELAEFRSVLAASRADGLTVEATGTVFSGERADSAAIEAAGFAVALVVMIISFASVVAASLPIATAVVGVGISVSLLTGATALFRMDSSSILLASMIGIAVSIDYSLFILSRYRQELDTAADLPDAAGRAVATAGSSVVFAGLTVVIALAGLGVVGNPLMTMLGYTAAVSVVVAVIVALTLLPAVLGLLGRHAFTVAVPRLGVGGPPGSDRSNGRRWAGLLVGHPRTALATAALGLAVIALPVIDLEVGMDLTTAEQKPAIHLLAEGFGDGMIGPLVVAADATASHAPETAYRDLTSAIDDLPGTATVTTTQISADRTGALIVVVPDTAPGSTATRELVDHIRGLEPPFRRAAGVEFGVTGQTAMMSDLAAALYGALLPYLALVIGMAFLVLMLAFRSLLVPLTATAGFMLSTAATLGATVAVFQKGWFGLVDDPQPLISFVPIYLIAILFGLSMDYQVFLVTRMREEYTHSARTDTAARAAVVTGFGHGARVVTSAALVMIAVFAAFILLPDTIAKSMGFALAIGMLFDAIVVRMIIIPAWMALLGARAWYLPRWLDRVLPDLDIEGHRLTPTNRTSGNDDQPLHATDGRPQERSHRDGSFPPITNPITVDADHDDVHSI